MRLDYQRAPNVAHACPDEEAFRHMVGVFNKGEDAFTPDAADVLRVTLDQRGTAYHATIAVLGPDGAQRGAAGGHPACVAAPAQFAGGSCGRISRGCLGATGPAAPGG